jgi:hypothetical protein
MYGNTVLKIIYNTKWLIMNKKWNAVKAKEIRNFKKNYVSDASGLNILGTIALGGDSIV